MDGTDNREDEALDPEKTPPPEAELADSEEIAEAAGAAPDGTTDSAAGAEKTETEEVPEHGEPMPKKKKAAVVRCTVAAALTLALLLLTNFGAFHLLFGGRELTGANMVPNRYLTFNMDTIIDYLAEDYKSGSNTVTGRYAIIPSNGEFIVVHLPERYLKDGDTIAVQTYNQLASGGDADKYFVVSGTVKAAPAEVIKKYDAWFNSNAIYMYQYGFIKSFDEKSIAYMVDVDSTGLFGDTACIAISCAAALLLAYAVFELVRILMGKYDGDGDITVEIFEDDSAGDADSDAGAAGTQDASGESGETMEADESNEFEQKPGDDHDA